MLGTIVDAVITTISITTPLAAYAALKGMFELDDRMRSMEIKYRYKEKELKKLLNRRKD